MVVLLRRRECVVERADRRARDQHAAPTCRDARSASRRGRGRPAGTSTAAAAPSTRAPGQPLRQPRRERPAQVRPPHVGRGDHAARRAPARGPRRTVSTSGSSGIRRPPRAVAARPPCLIRSGGNDRKAARHGRASPPPISAIETVPEAEKAARVHGVFASVAGALRPDERRHEPRRPPAVEGRAARLAGAAARDARCSTWRAAPATSPSASCGASEGQGPRHRPRHDRGHARPRAAAAPRPPTSPARSTGWSATRWRCPSPDASFDAYTISFGIRNVTRIQDALAEAFRVLRPGGRLLVLEFSRVPEPSAALALRPLFLQRHPAARPGAGRRPRQLPVPRRIDPPLPRPGRPSPR